jgi:two-component sensor histidine kinase
MADESDVDYLIDVDEIIFDIRVAIPLGLIINELIVNTIKHNYTHGNAFYFSLHLKEISSKNYKLTYKDPQSTMTSDDPKKTSFGLELIYLLASQLKSKIYLSFTDGLTVTMEFKGK